MPKVRNDARLLQEMADAGLDALVAFSMENVFYLSGSLFPLQDNIRDRLSAAGIAADGRDFLVAATNEMSLAERSAHVKELRGYVEFQGSAIEELALLLREMGLADATIGVEKRYLMAAYYEQLQVLLPRARLVSGDEAVEVARAIKTPEHIDIITRASRATEEALERTFRGTRAGETEKAMALRLILNLHEAGADVVRHAVLTVGDNARHAHPCPSAEKRLEPGDIIRVDCGGLFDGYGTDLARMGVVDAATPAQREHYAILRNVVYETAKALRPGTRARDIYRTAVEAYARQGVSGYGRDHVGHSLSILGSHDEPMLHARNNRPIEENMVIALEPIFRDEAGRRYTLEDVFLVTPEGGRLLTGVTDTTEMRRVR